MKKESSKIRGTMAHNIIIDDSWGEDFKSVGPHQNCLHNRCTECNGSGRKKDGSLCAHYISCPCEKCSPNKL